MDKFNVVIDLMWKTHARARVRMSFHTTDLGILVRALNELHTQEGERKPTKESEGTLRMKKRVKQGTTETEIRRNQIT